ncbi:MAG TPA: hypothetical protein VFY00_00715 [Arenimonas sp.]|nr:hypothetical protein [Arenimonas sp.]
MAKKPGKKHPAAVATDSGPAGPQPGADAPSKQANGIQDLASRFPHNAAKAGEFSAEGAPSPPQG